MEADRYHWPDEIEERLNTLMGYQVREGSVVDAVIDSCRTDIRDLLGWYKKLLAGMDEREKQSREQIPQPILDKLDNAELIQLLDSISAARVAGVCESAERIANLEVSLKEMTEMRDAFNVACDGRIDEVEALQAELERGGQW